MSGNNASRTPHRETTIGIALIVVTIGIILFSPGFGVIALVVALVWLALGMLTRRRRRVGKTALRAYWWIGLIWIICGLLYLLNEILS